MRTLPVFLALWLWAGAAYADCFDLPQTRVLKGYVTPDIARQVTVIIDQTTYFPKAVRDQVAVQVARYAYAGSEISIGSFSSYTDTRFPQVQTTVHFEAGLPTALDHHVNRLARDVLKSCLAYQQRQGIAQLQAALRARFEAARPSIGQSDIMSSIQQFGGRVGASSARDKVLLIVSDALENSSTASFYKAGKPRAIDPNAELHNAVVHGLIADLGGARVYIIGMALVPSSDDAAMPSDLVRRLEMFWTGYLRQSGASSVLIGKPLLLQ